MSYLSSLTTPLNISLGLKNAGDIITQVLPIVHFSVNEQCVEYKECSKFRKFTDAGKPVFHIEYPDSAGQKLREDVRSRYCGTGDEGKKGDTEGFSTVLKKMDLDGWVEYCDGTVEVTEVSGSGGKE
ncbi:unnamed protein product [Periconia digitata]|uniref:alpha-galactosidase n=1 Tax=Periconia digitata TaxID=1303443 RepID=A0A9W4XVQ1_9PLEO|nr:unnamed protein product [Periconia digitata]